MTVNDLYLDRLQEQQDRYSSEWQRQFGICNISEPPEPLIDLGGDQITEDEAWMTNDGLVPLSQIFAYCKDAIDEDVPDLETAIKLVENDGGYEI